MDEKMNIVEKINIFLNELASASLYNKRFGSKEDFEGWLNYREEKSRRKLKLKKKDGDFIKKLKKKFGLK